MTQIEKPKNILRKEQKTVRIMIRMYCSNFHESKKDLCGECSEMWDYASARLDYCTWGEEKPACSSCTKHCYKPERRERIREIMRYSGPRMMLKHPILAINHLVKMKKKPATNNL